MNEDIDLNPCEGENSRLNPLIIYSEPETVANQSSDQWPYDIKEKYKISNIVVNNWVSRHRHGKSLHANNGRPRALDKEGFKMIEGCVSYMRTNIILKILKVLKISSMKLINILKRKIVIILIVVLRFGRCRMVLCITI